MADYDADDFLPPPSFTNGRVPDVGQGRGAPAAFQLFSEGGAQSSGGPSSGSRSDGSSFANDSMQHIWLRGEASSATDLFMSRVNVDAVQEGIRYRVYVESNGRHVIDRQSDVELSLVMRSILLQRGRNDDGEGMRGAVEQVRELNAEVLAWCVPRVLSELDQYLHYRDDVSSLPVPMQRGGLSTNKGSRSLEMRPF